MRPRSRPSLALGLVLACQPSQADTSPFTTTPPNPGTSDASTGSSGSGSSTTTGSELSTSSGSGGASTEGTTLHLDVGGGDLGPFPSNGCKGKIDFLFVISRHDFMSVIQSQLVDAVPKFIDTIQTKFADFDYHIMVVKGDPWWGYSNCDAECPGPFTEKCPAGDDYPCEVVGKVPECDVTWGAGAVFNAGENAPNKPCEILDGRRYLTPAQPDLPETFACIAQVGEDGGDLLGEAMVHAVSPVLNGPGGCNEGFLRDDALLVVTLVTEGIDYSSEGTPAEWAQAVIDAKHGDDGSVVMFGIGVPKIAGECWKNQGLGQHDRDCDLVSRFTYSHWIDYDELDYGPGFDAATDLVEVACSEFIPQ